MTSPNDMARAILDLQQRLAKLEAGARTSQLQNASLTGTAITVYDDDGETPLQYIGKQGDGTVGTVAVNGPVPPAPSTPTLTPGQLSLTVAWDGTFVDADGDEVPRPTDVEGVQVHVSTSSGFTPNDGTLRGLLSVAGDLVVQPLEVVARYVKLVTITSSGVTSEPSQEATATPEEVVPGDGTITETKIADDAITTPKLAANAVTADKVAANAITAGKIDAGAVTSETIAADAIDGKTITGATIRTISSDSGFFVYAGEPTLGNLIISQASEAGVDDFGNSYPQGLKVNEGDISGSRISIEPGEQGIFVYADVPSVQTYNTPGTYTFNVPPGVTTAKVECWGGGGSGGSSGVAAGQGGGGGGGGEYAADLNLAVTPGGSHTVVVGAGSSTSAPGGNSSFTGASFSVVAHGGKSTNNRLGAAGGTGSLNPIHFNGGNGGNGSSGGGSTAGGGGGAAAGTTSAGGNGENWVGDFGGAGGVTPRGGGAGGDGGDKGSPGLNGNAPGGGGGGTGQGPGGGAGDGAHGMVRISYGSSGRFLVASIAADAGTDEDGNSYPAGMAVLGADDSYVNILARGGHADVLLQPPDTVGHTWNPAIVSGAVDPQDSGSEFPALTITSPWESGTTEHPARFFMAGPSTDLDDSAIFADANRVEITSSGSYHNTIIGGDLLVQGAASADSLTAGNIAGGSVTLTPPRGAGSCPRPSRGWACPVVSPTSRR
jgi:hypothetical protein